MAYCEVDEEFEGSNHKVSHDGVFRIKTRDIAQNILDKVSKIRVTVAGSYVHRP